MRATEYLQCINFGLLIKEKIHNQTIPIVLPITNEDKANLENIPNGDAGDDIDHKQIIKCVTLKYDGKIVALLEDYEIYPHRKEERAAAIFKTTNPGHPSIRMIMDSGDWLIGGDIKVFERIRWNDGLDEYRLTPHEIKRKFEQMKVKVLL